MYGISSDNDIKEARRWLMFDSSISRQPPNPTLANLDSIMGLATGKRCEGVKKEECIKKRMPVYFFDVANDFY